jgi:hypothetical protein
MLTARRSKCTKRILIVFGAATIGAFYVIWLGIEGLSVIFKS